MQSCPLELIDFINYLNDNQIVPNFLSSRTLLDILQSTLTYSNNSPNIRLCYSDNIEVHITKSIVQD